MRSSREFHGMWTFPELKHFKDLRAMARSLPSDPDDDYYLLNCFVCKEVAKPGQCHLRNYGGTVCFSCRQFFRRSQQQQIHFSFVCKNFGSCDVTVANRRKCQRCRYDRCVAAKMSPELVLNEEQKNFRFQRMIRKRRAMVASSTSSLLLSSTSTSDSSIRSPSPASSPPPYNSSTASSPTSITSSSTLSPGRFAFTGSVTSSSSPSNLSTSRSSTASLSPDISPTPNFFLDQLINMKHVRESSTALVDYSKMPKLEPIRPKVPVPGPFETKHQGFWNRGSNLSWFKSEPTKDYKTIPELIRSNVQQGLPPLVEISYPMLSIPHK